MEKTAHSGSSHPQRRIRVTEQEKGFILQCYEDKPGASWEAVLQHVKNNVQSCSRLSSVIKEFYLQQDVKQAQNRIRRIVRDGIKDASGSCPPVSGPMSDILKSKMRYAKKMTPEDRYESKFSHFSGNASDESEVYEEIEPDEGGEESDVLEELDVTKKAKPTQQDKVKGKRKGKGKRKIAEDAHVNMCNKAIATLDKVNKLLDKYEDSSSDE